MNVSILTIGDEICIGQIINTNAAWMAGLCTRNGLEVSAHSSVGDERGIMLREIDRLMHSGDAVLVTGGLGPTHDDITKPVLCEYFGDHLVMFDEALRSIEEFLMRRGMVISDRNKEQAMVPSKCTPILNSVGSAPGMIFEKDGKWLVSMPGVPSEMKAMMENDVIPFLVKLARERRSPVVLYKTFITAGVFESTLADLLGAPESFLGGGTLAFLPNYRGVRLRIGIKAADFDSANAALAKIERHIYGKAGAYIISTSDESLPGVIGDQLRKLAATLAVAESCTAGLLGAAITEVAGSSDYFLGGVTAYSDEVKIKTLGVAPATIESHGAVSEQTAMELAAGVRRKFGAAFALSITGIAGPGGGTPEKPVGTVWIGFSSDISTYAAQFHFRGDREVVRERAASMALTMLYEELKKMPV